MGHETGAYIAHHTTLLGHNNQWDWRKNAHIKNSNLITPHCLVTTTISEMQKQFLVSEQQSIVNLPFSSPLFLSRQSLMLLDWLVSVLEKRKTHIRERK